VSHVDERKHTYGAALVADLTVVIGAIAVLMGGWAFFRPASFFADFPFPGADWVSTLGTYNEHLMRDFGSAQIGLGLAGVIVGVRRSRIGISAVLWGTVVFGSLHFGYHVGTFGTFDTISAASQAAALFAFIVIPLVLLWALRRVSAEP
jgi:hypothetical protein